MVAKSPDRKTAGQKEQVIRPIYFEERPGELPYNASEVIALEDSRFLFCDNNISDALFEA
jgi:hypothetical protein